MTIRKRKHRGCWHARLRRARHARASARKASTGRLLAWLLFLLALLSNPVADVRATPGGTSGKRQSVPVPPLVPDDDEGSRPPSPYELGAPPSLRPRWRGHGSRYARGHPRLSRLLRDLRRPAAAQEAADMLMARVPAGDAELRDWVQGQLDDGSVTALAMWTRPRAAETEVFACWKEAARRQAEEEAAALRDALTRAGGEGGGGSDGVSGGTRKP